MADDLTTYAGVDVVLADTADYDVTLDLTKARRRVAALRRKIDFASEAKRGGEEYRFDVQVIQQQLQQALAFIGAQESQTDAQRLANPSVLHADFSGLRGGTW